MKMEPEPWFPYGVFTGGLEVGPTTKQVLLVVSVSDFTAPSHH